MKNRFLWFYDYLGIHVALFSMKHLSIFEKAKVVYGIHRRKTEVWVWVNYTQDSVRRTVFFEGHPTNVVYSVISLGEEIKEERQ